MDFASTLDLYMTRRAKQPQSNPRKSNRLLAIVVVIALLLIMLRMVSFVAGHRHHGL
jgi:hypothetical protein